MSWTNLQMPDRIELDEQDYTNTFGRFFVYPLEKGFGVTIGNMFRRVLLSSLHGAAISAIRVDGIQHEFSTIPGVYEDVAEMILNLKQVRLKLLNKKIEKVTIPVEGPGDLTAGDIQKHTSEIEVLNPNLKLASLEDDAKFEMELRIGKGRGFVPAEENKILDQPIGLIPIDAIYSPILNVKYLAF